jgi:hypothetical protein
MNDLSVPRRNKNLNQVDKVYISTVFRPPPTIAMNHPTPAMSLQTGWLPRIKIVIRLDQFSQTVHNELF